MKIIVIFNLLLCQIYKLNFNQVCMFRKKIVNVGLELCVFQASTEGIRMY